MPTDPLLRNAVRAIKEKIISGAATATPEELAYLGTAIDRIGGRATVLEVEEMGDIKIAEITEHAQAVETETINTITETKNSAEASITATKNSAEASIESTKTTAIASINTTKNAAATEIESIRSSAIASVNTAKTTAIAEANANRDAVIAAATSFKNQALADVAAAANSVTQQFVFGARAYFYAQL